MISEIEAAKTVFVSISASGHAARAQREESSNVSGAFHSGTITSNSGLLCIDYAPIPLYVLFPVGISVFIVITEIKVVPRTDFTDGF